jgi:hypothetical protein
MCAAPLAHRAVSGLQALRIVTALDFDDPPGVVGAPGRHPYSAPVLRLRQLQGGSLFDIFMESLEAVWEAGQLIDKGMTTVSA